MTDDRAKVWGQVVAGLRSATSLQFVNIAIDILRSEPSEGTGPLREWAIDLINAHSDIRVDDEARQVLLNQPWQVYSTLDTGVAEKFRDYLPATEPDGRRPGESEATRPTR